jgi:NAD+ synthase (glutamine-hydrolysing)
MKKPNKQARDTHLEHLYDEHQRQQNGKPKCDESALKIVAAQLNFTVGDIENNAAKIIANARLAKNKYDADIVLFPEMALTGYPPEDLLLRNELYERTQKAIALIKKEIKDIYVIFGCPGKIAQNYYNNAIVIYNGKIIATYSKQKLPNYGVFDEKRYFQPGQKSCFIKIKNTKIAITICEDLWFSDSILAAKKAQAKIVLALNASPFDLQKPFLREKVLIKRVKESKIPIVYANTIGGQDELIFDGGSMVIDGKASVVARAKFFVEELLPIEFKIGKNLTPISQKVLPMTSPIKMAYKALVLGVRDYIEKNNFKGAIIATSGGIDSALTLAITVDAIGKDRVETLFMPSRYSSKLSAKIAETQAKILEVKYHVISIEPIFQAYLKSLQKDFANFPEDITEENLQARCRGTLLMAFSNKKKLLVLSTGNKSEMSVGYATLYGDMVGGFCVLKDVPKTLVYRLANYRNKISKVIPESVIKRAPSAELKLNQKDTDSLPPYPILDEILERYIELDQSSAEISKAGFAPETVAKIIRMVNNNEYKRRQAPPGVRITVRAFGRDRRYPITSKF